MAEIDKVTVLYLNWVAAVDVRDSLGHDYARAQRAAKTAYDAYQEALYEKQHAGEGES
jgi:hypothetical protein